MAVSVTFSATSDLGMYYFTLYNIGRRIRYLQLVISKIFERACDRDPRATTGMALANSGLF